MAQALADVYQPVKMNYELLGNQVAAHPLAPDPAPRRRSRAALAGVASAARSDPAAGGRGGGADREPPPRPRRPPLSGTSTKGAPMAESLADRKRRAARILTRLGADVSRRAHRARLEQPARAPRRHHPVRPVHRPAREPGDGGALPPLPLGPGLGGRRRPPVSSARSTRRASTRPRPESILGMARALVERHGGEVPRTLEALTDLPGVGRKTANVVLGNAFGIPAFPVDTHVTRVSQRLGLTRGHRCRGDPRRSLRADPPAAVDQGQPSLHLARPADLSREGAQVPGMWCPRPVPLAGEDPSAPRRDAGELHGRVDRIGIGP